MAYEVQTLYPRINLTGEGGAQNKQLADTIGSSEDTSKVDFGTDATARYILVKPGATNATSGTPANNQNFGWNVLVSNMDNGSGTPNVRRIPSGTWTFQCVVSGTADATGAWSVKVYMHKRSSAGVLTEIFNAETATAALGATAQNFTVSKTGVAEQILQTGETIHAEYWINGRGITVVGQIASFRTGPTAAGLAQDVLVLLPTPGLRTKFLRSLVAVLVGLVPRPIKRVGKKIVRVMVGVAGFARRVSAFRKFTTSTVVVGTYAGQAAYPSDIASLFRDWDPQTLNTTLNDADPISTWTDSISSSNATQTSTARPLLKKNIINGRSVVRFDGSDDHFALSTFSLTNWSIFVVHKTTGDCDMLGKNGANVQGLRIGRSGSAVLSTFSGGTEAVSSAVLTVPRSSFSIVEMVVSAGVVQFFENGTQLGTNQSNGGTAYSLDDIGIQMNGNTPGWLNGDIARLIICNAAVSSTDRVRMENYLKDAFAIAGGSGTPNTFFVKKLFKTISCTLVGVVRAFFRVPFAQPFPGGGGGGTTVKPTIVIDE